MFVLEKESAHCALECHKRDNKEILHWDNRCQASDLMAQIAVCPGEIMTKEITVHRLQHM